MPRLYHATRRDLPLNQAIIGQERTTKPIDLEFDARRPEDVTPRSRALFSSDDPAFAFVYLMAECAICRGQLLLYEVDMPCATKHPMILVSHAQRFLRMPATLEQIITEYWNPTCEWKCWEYLGDAMTPTADEVMPDIFMQAGAKHRYGEDLVLARQLWPCPAPA